MGIGSKDPNSRAEGVGLRVYETLNPNPRCQRSLGWPLLPPQWLLGEVGWGLGLSQQPKVGFRGTFKKGVYRGYIGRDV